MTTTATTTTTTTTATTTTTISSIKPEPLTNTVIFRFLTGPFPDFHKRPFPISANPRPSCDRHAKCACVLTATWSLLTETTTKSGHCFGFFSGLISSVSAPCPTAHRTIKISDSLEVDDSSQPSFCYFPWITNSLRTKIERPKINEYEGVNQIYISLQVGCFSFLVPVCLPPGSPEVAFLLTLPTKPSLVFHRSPMRLSRPEASSTSNMSLGQVQWT